MNGDHHNNRYGLGIGSLGLTMVLDQISLLTAIAFSAIALAVTLFIGWLGARRDAYLLNWSMGLLLVLVGVIGYGMTVETYDPRLHAGAFVMTLLGFAFIYAGTIQFRAKPIPIMSVAIMTLGLMALVIIPFLVGLSGVGSILANLGLAVFMALSGYQFWAGRQEARVPMTVNAALYGLASVSFVLCAIVIVAEGNWVLTAWPKNWAELANAITMIICLTGIGAISLTLNQSRWTRHHRNEARTDSLTGLLNRRALFDCIGSTELAAGTAVIMLDLDHFKAINDELGHAGGDSVLSTFAAIVGDNIRSEDLAARLGGEEFCVVLTGASSQSVPAAAVAERIRAAFESSSSPTARGPAATTVSAGVAVSARGGEPFEDVLRRADDALYAAKEAGRNRVHAPSPRLVA